MYACLGRSTQDPDIFSCFSLSRFPPMAQTAALFESQSRRINRSGSPRSRPELAQENYPIALIFPTNSPTSISGISTMFSSTTTRA